MLYIFNKIFLMQAAGEAVTVIVISLVLIHFIRQFRTSKKQFYPLFLILLMFSIGFGLRLSGNNNFIDFGYFLTDVSYLFTYMMFTATFILGQKKYWKVM